MRIIDLSHVIHDGMVTYPGLPGPEISDHLGREASRSHYAPGTEFHIGRVSMVANTGTYLDTPFHRFPDGWGLQDLPLDKVAGVSGLVIDSGAHEIGPDAFAGVPLTDMAVLFRTGWSRHWGTDAYGDPDHPHLTETAVDALVSGRPAVVGIDSVNIDDTRTGHRPAHSGLLRAGIPIVEHLTGLAELPVAGFEFFAVPVKVAGMGTFPVRAFAVVRQA
jgi:kynurenine formamidase